MKTVLITGAARGIGAAAAERFAEAGYQVVINYLRSAEKAEALAARWSPLSARLFRRIRFREVKAVSVAEK